MDKIIMGEGLKEIEHELDFQISEMFEDLKREIYGFCARGVDTYDLDADLLKRFEIDSESIQDLFLKYFKEDFDYFVYDYIDHIKANVRDSDGNYDADRVHLETSNYLNSLFSEWSYRFEEIMKLVGYKAADLSKFYDKLSQNPLSSSREREASEETYNYGRALGNKFEEIMNRTRTEINALITASIEKHIKVTLEESIKPKKVVDGVSSYERSSSGKGTLKSAYFGVTSGLKLEDLSKRNSDLVLCAESLSTYLALADVFGDEASIDNLDKYVKQALNLCNSLLDLEDLFEYMRAYASKGGYAAKYLPKFEEYYQIKKEEIKKQEKNEQNSMTEREPEKEVAKNIAPSELEKPASLDSQPDESLKEERQKIVNVLGQVVDKKREEMAVIDDSTKKEFEASKRAYEEVSTTRELSDDVNGKTSAEIDIDLNDFAAQESLILNSKHFTDEQKAQMIEELYREFDTYVKNNPEKDGRIL